MNKKLSFPSFEFRIEKINDKLMIFDVLRKKSVRLTPEEWVRQHLIRYLIEYRQYPKSMIRVESGLKYDKLLKRSDILVFGQDGNPWMVIECKSPDTKLDDKVIHQVAAYSRSLQVKYIGISNGLKHYCWEIDQDKQSTRSLGDFPEYK
ncbi:MAG: type I restriction enzyme HsdR N-terminal domain-containing protein [Cyclobacteriaceae bacterium]